MPVSPIVVAGLLALALAAPLAALMSAAAPAGPHPAG